MERANLMTMNYKNFYLTDDIVLSNFCPNTYKVIKRDKFITFRKSLHSFHQIAEIYENTIYEYMGYIVNSILLNSLELNKNILAYEQYFYNIVQGYSRQSGNKITTANIAKCWNNLVQVYNLIIQDISRENVKEVKVLQKGIGTVRYINVDQVNNNYYWDIPIQLVLTDNSIKNILILPTRTDNQILSNLNVLSTINRYINSDLSVVQISLDSINIRYGGVHITPVIRQYVSQYFKTTYVDFSTANLSNCVICPLNPCTIEQMFKVVQPTTVQKIKKIRLVNE